MQVLLMLMMIIFSAGCASNGLHGDQNLSLDRVLSLKVDRTRDLEVVEKLGQPNSKNVLESQETWSYVDAQTGEQRLVLTFSDNARILKSILWLPQPKEPEIELNNVISRFPNLKIEPVDQNKINPHSPVEDITYRDDAAGQVVLANEARSKVEALAWYSRDARDITGAPPDNQKRHFDIGK